MSAAVAGDIQDVKRALAALLGGQDFLDTLAAVVAEKGDAVQAPQMVTGAPTVLTYERLTKQVAFPLCELLSHQSAYGDTMVKAGVHRVGVRWTVVEGTEKLATESVELLCRATVDLCWGDARTRADLLPEWAALLSEPLKVVEEDYSPLLPLPDRALMRSGLVVVEVSTWRD